MYDNAKREVAKYEYQPPSYFIDIYNAFWKLRYSITPDASVSYQELHAYCQVTKNNFSPSEIGIFEDMDLCFSSAYLEFHKQDT